MRIRWTFYVVVLLITVSISVGVSLAQSNQTQSAQIKPAANASSSVKGSGTPDRITKWVGNQEIGDSGIIETDGNVGVGTNPHPTAKFFVLTNSSENKDRLKP